MEEAKPPKGYLDLSPNQNWKPCIVCGKDEILQVRKALFTCNNCNQEFIAEEKDMR